MYIIWSHRNDAFWQANRSGYVTEASKAGRYSREETAEICLDSSLPGANVAIDEQLVGHLTDLSPMLVKATLARWSKL